MTGPGMGVHAVVLSYRLPAVLTDRQARDTARWVLHGLVEVAGQHAPIDSPDVDLAGRDMTVRVEVTASAPVLATELAVQAVEDAASRARVLPGRLSGWDCQPAWVQAA